MSKQNDINKGTGSAKGDGDDGAELRRGSFGEEILSPADMQCLSDDEFFVGVCGDLTGDEPLGEAGAGPNKFFAEDNAKPAAAAAAASAKKQPAEKAELTPLLQEEGGKSEGNGAPLQLAMNRALAIPSSLGINVAKKNERGFYTAEVVMMLSASLADLASGKVEPELSLAPQFAGFEVPGMEKLGRQTEMHAQGQIKLLGVRNSFPVSIGMVLDDRLRGSRANTVHSNTGVKCAHIALVDDKLNYSMAPLVLAHSDIGLLTEQYASEYPEYLAENAVKQSVKKVRDQKHLAQVKIGSPVHHAIDKAREKLRAENESKSAAEKLDANTLKPLDTTGTHAVATGYTYATAVEVVRAMQKMDKVFKDHVNYVPLYKAFRVGLVRPFAASNESGAATGKAQWKDLREVEGKKSRGAPMSQDQKAAALNEVHTLHARFLVEYSPLTSINQL